MSQSNAAAAAHGAIEPIADKAGPAADIAFFGHPRGLGFLAGTELWERFSFFSMQSLLMLYMTKYLLTADHAGKVAGLGVYRSVVERVFGPMTDLALAAQTFGLYSGLILVTPLIGAWLGDRVIGRTRTVAMGALLMSAGHLTMAIEQGFLLALALLIVGGGLFVSNLSAQIGSLYAADDTRRTRAFGIYMIVANIGQFVAPLISGTLGERVGWHWGFGAAGIGMLIGLATYLVGRKHLPPDTGTRGTRAEPLTGRQWRSIGGLVLLYIPKLFFFAAVQQAYGIMVVWADKSVDRTVGGFEIPATWALTADGILTIAGVFLATRIWERLAARGREPHDVRKIGIANLIAAASFLLIAAFSALPQVPAYGWMLFYLVLDISFGWFDPPARALVARYAPRSVNGTMFALYTLSGAFGFFLLGWLGRFFEPLGPTRYFLLTASLPIAGAVMLIAFARPLERLLAAGDADRSDIGKRGANAPAEPRSGAHASSSTSQ